MTQRRPPLAHVAVALVEPVEPGNVGAVARVMGNLGVGELALVVADESRRAALLGGEARARACHGAPILEAARLHATLDAATAGARRVYAFTSRTGKFRQPRTTLAQAAQRIASRRDERSLLVFGREDRGLEGHEVALAHELVTIPVSGEDRVLNLSHAVAIALWEVARSCDAFVEPPDRRKPARSASAEDRAALRADVAQLLVELDLPRGRHGDLHGRILRRFMDLFDRAGGEHSDFGMLRGLFVGVRRKWSKGPKRSKPRPDDPATA
jgi:TrmH family RNA methyltransferase